MDWKAIEKLVDMETEKKTRDISLASSNPYQSSGGYYSQNLYSRPTLSASPPPFSSMDRQGDRYVSTTNNSMQDISFAGPQSPSHRITTNDLNASRSYMPGPNPSSSIHGQLTARDEISEMRQMLFQYSHRLQEVEDTLQRTVEGQQTLQRQRIELQDKCSLYEQEMKTLKSSHFQLHKEKEELLINNHKLQSTIDHIQQNVQKNVDNYATKDTMIKFIDSTMEQMKILNQNLHLTTSKNQEIQLTLDNFILSLLDMGSVTSNTSGTTANGPPSMMSDASGKGNTGTSTSALMNTYQLLKSNTGFSEQIKSLIQSSLSQNIHTLFQSSIKGFQDNLQSYINMQLKDFKEKQLQTVQTFLDSRVNTYYQNELNIVKADMMQFKHTFDEYQKISQLLASQLQPGRMSSVGGLGASGGSGIGGSFGLGGSGGMSKEQEELTGQVKDKLTNIEKTITELQNQQKQYHMILTNQNDIITNNTNLQESSRIYYDNYFKQLMKDFNELDKKVDTSLKTYQNMKDELLSDNWTNQNKIIKDLSDRNLLISSQINQMKTELQDTVNYITSQIINNNNNLREEFSLLLKNKDLKLEDIQQRLTVISELTIQLNETDLINKKNSKEIEEILLMMKSSEYQQKVQHEQHQQKIFNVTETINNIEKQLKDELQLQQLKQKEKNTSFDAMFTSIQDLQHVKWNEIITHQNTLLQEMNDKYSQFNELNNKTREQSLQNNEKLVTLMSKIEILDISFKKDLELLKLDVLDQITSKTDDFFTFNSSLEKKFEEIKEELSLIQNKTLLYQENHTEMMKTYHNEFNKYDKELNKYQLQLNNLQELLNHRYDKLQYNLDEQLKFTNISLSQLDKDITNKLTQLQQSNDANILNIQKDIETSNQSTEYKLQLLSMQTQSDSQKVKESIIKVLQDLFNEQFQLMNQKLSNQDKESNNNFNTMAEKLLEFSTALNFLEDEDHRLNETMTKNKELLQSELYTWKNKIWNELEGLQKNTKESQLETKYELSQLFNKLQILESRPSGNANPVNLANAIGGSGVGAMTMGNLLGGLGDDDGGGDQSFSYQHSFLYDPNNPYQGVQPNQPPEDRGGISSEQMMKLSSVVELSSTRIGQVETDIFNLQTEVKSLQNLKDQCKLLQDQMSNIGKMQAGFMELTKGLALQSSSNSNTPVDGVTIEMLLKAKNELKSEYNEQNRQLSVNLFEQEARVKEELKKLQEDFHKTIEIAQIGQKQEGGHTSGEIEKILSDWKSEHQSSYNQIAQRVQLLDQQVQEKDNQSTKQIGAVREELQKVFQQQLRSVENTVEAQKLQLHLIDENLAKLTVSAEEWKQLEKEIADITQNDIPATKTEISQSRTELELLQKEVKRLAEALVVAPSSIPATALSSSEIAETKEELQVLKKEVKRLAEAQVVAQSSILAPASAEIAETKEKVHLLQKEVKKIADAHLVAQSSIPAPTSSEIAETKEKLQVLQKEVSRLTEAHSENSTQLQNQRIDEDSTVQLLQTEIQALKEIYEKYKDAQTIQQEQMVNWKASLTEQFEERIQLLTQQEENNNNHQIHLMAALEEELKKMKELILVSQPSVPPPPPTKTPPLSPAKMASPMSAEVIENTVFTKLSQVMKNEISNLSNERNKQNEINLLTMHTKLQHSIEEKLQSLSSTLNETNKRSEVDRESFQHFQKEFNDAQLKEKIVQLREEWAKFLADSKSKDENFEERIGDVEFSQKQLTERLQSSLDSFQNKSNSLQEQMQVLQEEILSLSESKDDIPKLVSAAFVDQKDALLKSFLEEIKKFKPPTPAPPANTTPQASPKVPVNTDNSIKLTLASPSVTPNTSTSVKPVAEGASKVSVESKEVPIIAAPSKHGADSPKKTSTVTVEEKTATEPKLGLEKASSINTPPAVSTNKEIKVTSNITEPTVSSSTLVGPNTTNKNEEKPISERSVQEIANSMSVSPAVSPVKENVNKSGNFEESFINRSTSSDSISSGTGKPPLASPLTKKTSFSSSISKLNEKLGTTKPATQAELKTTPTASAAASPVKYSPADLKQVTLSSPIKTSDDKSLPSSLSTPSASSIDIGKTISTPERNVMSNDGSKLIPSEGAVISSSLTKIMTSPRPSTDNSAIIPNSAKTEAKSLVTPPSTPKKTDTPSSAVKAETTDKTNASLSSPKLIPAAGPPAQKQEAKEDKAESLKIASTASTPSREKTSSASSTPGENRRSSSILDKIAAFETKNITKDAAPASRATSSTEKVEFVVNKPPESDKTAKSDTKMDDIKPNTSSVPNQTPLRKKPELDDSFDAEDDENELSPASKGSSKLDASTSFLSPISSDTSPIKHSERKAVVPSVGRQRLQNDGDEEESNEIHLNFDQSSSHYLSEVSQTPPRKTVSSNQDSHEDRQDNEKRRRHLLSSLADDEEFVSSSEESSVMGKDDEHDDDEEDDDEEEGDDSFGSPRASSTLQGPPQSFVAGVSFPMVTTPDRGPVHRVNPISSTVPAPSPLNATVSNPLPPSTSAGSVNTAPLPATATTSSNAPASTASSNVVLSGSLLGRSKK